MSRSNDAMYAWALHRNSLYDFDLASFVLRSLYQEAPSLAPRLLGFHDPIRTPFDIEKIESLRPNWFGGVEWKGHVSGSDGSISVGGGKNPVHAQTSLSSPLKSKQLAPSAVSFLDKIAVETAIDFAFVHKPSEREVEKLYSFNYLRDLNRAGTQRSLSVHTIRLRHGLHEIFWYTIFGEPYVSLIGRDKLRSAPAAVVRELGPDTFGLQLTESLESVESNYEEFETRREAVKRHIGWPLDVPEFRYVNLPPLR